MSIFSTRPQPAPLLAAILCLAGLLFSTSVLAQHQAFDKGYKPSPFYFGVAYGTPDNDILPTGYVEKEDDVAWKIYAGRKFARFFGVEIGFADLGSTDASGADTLPLGLLDDTTPSASANLVGDPNGTEYQVVGTGFIDLNATTIFITGTAQINLLKNLTLMGRAGWHFWETNPHSSVNYTGYSSRATANDPYAVISDTTKITNISNALTSALGSNLLGSNSSVNLVEDDDGNGLLFAINLEYNFQKVAGIRIEWEQFDMEDSVEFTSVAFFYHF